MSSPTLEEIRAALRRRLAAMLAQQAPPAPVEPPKPVEPEVPTATKEEGEQTPPEAPQEQAEVPAGTTEEPEEEETTEEEEDETVEVEAAEDEEAEETVEEEAIEGAEGEAGQEKPQEEKRFYAYARMRWRDTATLQKCIQAVNALLKETPFEMGQDGLVIHSLDRSHISLYHIQLRWLDAYSYEVRGDQPFRVAVDNKDLLRIFKMAKKGDSIELEVEQNGDEVSFKVKLLNGITREYQVPASPIHSFEVTCPTPRIDFTASATFDIPTLLEALQSMEAISENAPIHVTIQITRDGITFTGRGDEREAKVELQRYDPQLLELEVSEEAKATYRLNYLLPILKALKGLKTTIRLEMGNKKPLRLTATIPSTTSTIQYYQAPMAD